MAPSSKFIPVPANSATPYLETSITAMTTSSQPCVATSSLIAVKRESLSPRFQDVPENKRRRIERPHGFQPTMERFIPFQPTSAPGAHAFLPPPLISTNSFTRPPPQAFVSPPGFPLQVNTGLDHTLRSSTTRPPLFYHSPPAAMISPPSMRMSFFTNEVPKVGPAANNRIFVDGRVYEVFYLNNQAVIEKDSLPHRIFFTGSPRTIMIDGKHFNLGFNEVKTILLDGIQHSIRFGAPSRELYISDYPFRGAFDGSAMIANINGRRHEFRLCGPPPEVQIDYNPCYELSRHMLAARNPQNSTPKPAEKLVTKDIFALLQKVKQNGILNQLLTNSADASKTSSFPQKPLPLAVPLNVSGGSEVPAAASLKDFDIDSLMFRYSEVVEALHQPRISCSHCGIGFDDTNSEAYRRHIDSHVQGLLKIKNPKNSRVRAWNFDKEAWLQSDEFAEVQKEPSKESSQRSNEGCSFGMSQNGVTSSDAIATTSLNKICTVCFEKFIEYYDNDEEEWRFKDCIVKGKIAIHRYCLEEMEDGRYNDNDDDIENHGISCEIKHEEEETVQKEFAFPV